MNQFRAKNRRGVGIASALFVGLLYSSGALATEQLPTTPSAADRIEATLALEEIRYSHQEWPEANMEPKPPLDQFFSREDAVRLVDSQMRMGTALRNLWQEEVPPQEIQAEMERMALGSKLPDRLQEYWAALGNDPLTIAECLVRPLLTEQKLRERYIWDKKLHAEVYRKAAAEVALARSRGALGSMSGTRSQCQYLTLDRLKGRSPEEGEMLLGVEEWQALRQRVSVSQPGFFGNQIGGSRIGPLQESQESFFAQVATEVEKGQLVVTTYSWPKRSFDVWWEAAQQDQTEEIAPAAVYRLPGIPYRPENAHENWTAINTTGAPTARRKHGVVWTGSKMIVWGGEDFSGTKTNTGGAYDPATDSWTATLVNGTTPIARIQYRNAAWSGSYMIVWGETSDSSGGRYNPTGNSWTALNLTGAPTPRSGHCAVWNTQYVVVWGGKLATTGDTNTGGRLSVGSVAWTTMNNTSAPFARRNHAAAYDATTGMIVWGGSSTGLPGGMNSGGQYTNGDGWPSATNLTGAPPAREYATGVWGTGPRFIVWGGNAISNVFSDGGRWTGPNAPGAWAGITATNAPLARTYHSAVWAPIVPGMVVWGGQDLVVTPTFFNTGARYNPATDVWTVLSTTGAPTARSFHSAAYAEGSYQGVMLVWGGGDATAVTNTGGAYHFCKVTAVPATTGAITAVDLNSTECTATGVRVTWPQEPSGGWGDDGFGPRSYAVLRGGVAVTTLAYPATTTVDVGGTPNTAYNYTVRYANGCGHTADSPAASATDATDTVPCAEVGETLFVTRAAPNANFSWTAVVCGDFANYRLYGATTYGATFPAGWTLLAWPVTNAAQDALASAYVAYRVVSVDACGNPSVN